MTILAQQVQDELATAVSKDQLDLPTLPEVALRIRDAAEDENISVQSLAAVISEDPGLTGRMIKVAEPDFVDVVMVANLQTLVGTDHPFTQLDWQEIQAFHNLGLDPDMEASQLEDLEEDLAEAKDAFV